MAGSYEIHRSGSSQFHWDLKGGNGEKILSSELYNSKQAAQGGIESCRVNSAVDARYTRLKSKDDKPYFVLKAANGEVIGTSQMYSADAARDGGIASCKQNGPASAVKDTT